MVVVWVGSFVVCCRPEIALKLMYFKPQIPEQLPGFGNVVSGYVL